MPRHRGGHLAQRIGENIRQHQIERAALREIRSRESNRLDCLHQIAGPVQPCILVDVRRMVL